MSKTMSKTTTTTTTATTTTNTTQIVAWWGTAAVTRDKDGVARKYAAVRYIAGVSGYKTEADYLGGRVPDCPTRNHAIVRAVECAIGTNEAIDAKTAEIYPSALAYVRRELAEKAGRIAKAAVLKAEVAKRRESKAESEAATILAGVHING